MHKYCEACSAPLAGDFKGPAENYCVYCSDKNGNLKPREEILDALAHWIQSWQDVSPETASARAEHFMKAMPAWADD